MTKLAQVLYSLGEVADGKKSLKEVIGELDAQNEEERKQFFDQARGLLNDFKRTVKESYKDRTMAKKYDMSAAAMRTLPDGTRQYIGVRPKEKHTPVQSFVKSSVELFNGLASGAQKVADFAKDTADLMSGQMTPEQFEAKHPTKTFKELGQDALNIARETAKSYEKALDATKVGRGLNSVRDGLKATVAKLRGLGEKNKVVQSVAVDGRVPNQSGRGGFGGRGESR